MANIEPINDRVLIQRDPEETVTKGGIVRPDAHLEKALTGTVLATGPGRVMDGKLWPMSVKPGERVVYGRFAGVEFPTDLGLGDDLLMAREDEILGILR